MRLTSPKRSSVPSRRHALVSPDLGAEKQERARETALSSCCRSLRNCFCLGAPLFEWHYVHPCSALLCPRPFENTSTAKEKQRWRLRACWRLSHKEQMKPHPARGGATKRAPNARPQRFEESTRFPLRLQGKAQRRRIKQRRIDYRFVCTASS